MAVGTKVYALRGRADDASGAGADVLRFDVVADKGRWTSAAATRQYITTALQELANHVIEGPFEKLLHRYARYLVERR